MQPTNNGVELIGQRYQLLERLGAGGMGAVYRATDRLTGQTVALKRVLASSASPNDPYATVAVMEEQVRVALANEFQTLASLHHPHIIQVLDYGFEVGQQPYFTMGIIDKARTIVDAGRGQPLQHQCNLLIQMAEALAYLHRRGLVHRDLKPDNALVTGNGEVKVLDFGLAALHDPQKHSDEIVGTLAYIAPELLQGHPASPASDFYALGMIAYEMFSGSHPYGNKTANEIVVAVLTQAIDLTGAEIDTEFYAILERLLSKQPSDRYGESYEIIADLSAALGQPVPLESIAIRESYLQAARFVGRAEELGKLVVALDDTKDGKGSAWLVGGESGVGKSRLLDELRTQALVKGALVLRGQGVMGGGLSYQVWREPIRRLLLTLSIDDLDAGILREFIADIERLLGRNVPPVINVEGTAHQERLIGAVTNLFQQLTQPTLLVLEDLQWSDESLDILQTLNSMVADLPLLIVASYQTEERPDLPETLPDMQVMILNRLRTTEMTELSVSMLGEAGRQPEVVQLLQRETEGNAFFLVEVVRALAEEAGRLNQIGQMALPEKVVAGGIQEVIQRRLDNVPQSAQPWLHIAALAGRELDLTLLHQITGSTDLDNWLTTCANSAVLEARDGNWQFSHEELRQAALRQVPDEQRARIHRDIAGAIETIYPDAPDQAIILAQHWRGAGDHLKERIYSQKAGDYSLRISTLADGIGCLERALELVPQTAESEAEQAALNADIRAKLGEMLLYHGAYDAAATRLENALTYFRTQNEERRVAQILNLLGEVAWQQGEYERANTLVNEALQLGQKLDVQSTIARSLNRLGMVAFDQGDYQQAARHFNDSLKIADNNPADQATAMNNLGIAAYVQGDLDEAQHYFEETVALGRSTGERRKVAYALLNLGNVAGMRGNLAGAIGYFDQTLQTYRAIGERRGVVLALHNLGFVAHLQKEYDRALNYYRESLELARAIGDPQRIALNLVNIGNVAKDQRDNDSARRYYQQALQQAYEIHATPTVIEVIVGLAQLTDDWKRSLHWLGMIQNHPATTDATRGLIDPIIEDLRQIVSPENIEAELAHGKTLELETVVNELLGNDHVSA